MFIIEVIIKDGVIFFTTHLNKGCVYVCACVCKCVVGQCIWNISKVCVMQSSSTSQRSTTSVLKHNSLSTSMWAKLNNKGLIKVDSMEE